MPYAKNVERWKYSLFAYMSKASQCYSCHIILHESIALLQCNFFYIQNFQEFCYRFAVEGTACLLICNNGTKLSNGHTKQVAVCKNGSWVGSLSTCLYPIDSNAGKRNSQPFDQLG